MEGKTNLTKIKMIHELIDHLFEIEETSLKGVSFSYSTSIGLDFHFTERPGSGQGWVGGMSNLYTTQNWDLEKQFISLSREIEKIKNTPDTEPKVTVHILESEAKKMGLIA